jgi:cation transport ATPase
MRIRVPSAKGDPAALEEIRRAMASVSGVNAVTVNEALGTVTVNYDPSKHDEIHHHLTADESHQKVKVAGCPKLSDLHEVDEMFEKEAEFLARHSHTARVLLDSLNQIDNGIKKATGNAVDLKVIAPLALAVGVFMELGVAAATPVWLTLGLFSFNHFIDLHAHHDNDEKEQESPVAAAKKPASAPSPRR